MEISNMKNIVVLKNLPSNLVEEAIVILKTNKEAKKLEHIESVISSYISKIEKNKNDNLVSVNIERKYKKLKIYSIIASVILLLSIFL